MQLVLKGGRRRGRKGGKGEREGGSDEKKEEKGYSQDPEFSFLRLRPPPWTVPSACLVTGDSRAGRLALHRALCPSLASSQRTCFGDQDTGLKVKRQIRCHLVQK